MSNPIEIPNHEKIILDLCGGTGSWSKPYLEAGYRVINVTLPEYDVRTYEPPAGVYGILAAPPCTMFSFARMKAKLPRNLPEGMEIVKACLEIIWKCQYRTEKDTQKKPPLRFWALENPKGMLEWFLGKPAMMFQPYEYGNPYQKKTCLWGVFNIPPKLFLTGYYDAYFDKIPMCKLRELLNCDSTRQSELRSVTPSGFAKAFFMANQ